MRSIIEKINKIIDNPITYLALVIGALTGGVHGAGVGVVAGGLYGHAYLDCTQCFPHMLGLNIFFIEQNIVGGVFSGLLIGALLGGLVISLLTTALVLKQTHLPSVIGNHNIREVIIIILWIALELSIGIVLGGIVGSLQSPGVGAVLGALFGLMLIGLTRVIEKRA